MSDPMFDNATAVTRVADTVEITGALPGPAGSASMDLGHGVRLEVDYAVPDVMVACTLPATGLTTPVVGAIVDQLLGADVGAQVRTFAATDADTARLDPEARWVTDEGVPRGRVIGELVCIADRIDDPRRPVVERALAGLDLAEIVERDSLVPCIAAAATAATDRALVLLGECLDELVERAAADPRIAERLLDVHGLRLPGSLYPVIRRRIEHAEAALAMPSDAPMVGDLDPDSDDLEPALRSESMPVARMMHLAPSPEPRPEVVGISGGVWLIECPTGRRPAPERWVRVLDVDLTVVAAARLDRADGPTGPVERAEVVVPGHCTPANTRLEVLIDPFPAGPGGLDAVAAAVWTGRRAVDLEAVASHDIAARHWAHCAEAWAELGDPTRAELARARAKRPTGPSRRGVLGVVPLCDAVAGPLT